MGYVRFLLKDPQLIWLWIIYIYNILINTHIYILYIYIYFQTVSNNTTIYPHWCQHPQRPVSLPFRNSSWSGCGTAWCMKTMSKMPCPWAWMPREVLVHLRRVKHWNLSACRCCDPSQGDISWVTLLPDYSSIYVRNKSIYIIYVMIFNINTIFQIQF